MFWLYQKMRLISRSVFQHMKSTKSWEKSTLMISSNLKILIQTKYLLEPFKSIYWNGTKKPEHKADSASKTIPKTSILSNKSNLKFPVISKIPKSTIVPAWNLRQSLDSKRGRHQKQSKIVNLFLLISSQSSFKTLLSSKF